MLMFLQHVQLRCYALDLTCFCVLRICVTTSNCLWYVLIQISYGYANKGVLQICTNPFPSQKQAKICD